MTLQKQSYKILYCLIGIILALGLKFIGLKLVLFAVIAVAGIIISINYLEISIGLFLTVMFIAPHEMWNNLYMFYAVVFYYGIYIIRVVTKKRVPFKISDINLPILFLIFFSLYSTIISFDFMDALRIFVLQTSAMGFAILLLGIAKDKKSLGIIIDFICISLLLASVYAILQKYVFKIEIKAEFIDTIVSADMPGRVFSNMDNANNFAEYLVLFLPLCFANVLNTKDEIKKIILTCISALGIFVLIYTLSRGSYIAFAIGFVFFALLVNKRLVFFGVIVLIALIPLGYTLLDLFAPEFLLSRIATIGKDSSSKYRLSIWEGAFEMLKAYWITGIGMGPNTFKNVFPNFCVPEAARAMHSHNLMLQQFLELGLLGFISFISLIVSNLRANLAGYLNTNDSYFKNLFAAFIFSITAILAFGMVEYVWYYPRVMFGFWCVIGLSFAAVNIQRGERDESTSSN